MIAQKIKKPVEDSLRAAQKYYQLLSVINNFNLTEKEIQLLAFTAIRGNMTDEEIREDFCREYDTTTASINNIVSRLKRTGLLVKANGFTKLHKVVNPGFDEGIVLQINITVNGIH